MTTHYKRAQEIATWMEKVLIPEMQQLSSYESEMGQKLAGAYQSASEDYQRHLNAHMDLECEVSYGDL